MLSLFFLHFFFTFLLLKQILERHHRKATMEVLLCHLSGALEVCSLSLSLFLVWKSNSLQLSTSLHYDPIDFSFIIIIIFLEIGFPTSPPPQEHNGSSTLPPVGSPIGQPQPNPAPPRACLEIKFFAT